MEERERERERELQKSFHFIMKGHWQILSSYQPTVNYAKDDLQIQLPFVSGKMIEVSFSIDIRPTCHNKILRRTNKPRYGCEFKYIHILKQK